MAEQTSYIESLCRGLRLHGSRAVPALLLVLVAVGCSGGSSEDRDEDGEETAADTRSADSAADRGSRDTGRRNPRSDDGSDDGRAGVNDDDGGNGDNDRGASGDAFDPDALIRRLDRLVAGTDARMLRSGLATDAAPASLSLDTLEERLKSAQARMRSPASAGEERP